MPIGDASEAMDTLYPLYRIAEQGFQVVVAGPERRVFHLVIHEVPEPDEDGQWDITRELPAYHLQASVAFSKINPTEYAGLFLSGGRAPEYLRYDQDLLRITRHFFEANKPVGCVCHGIEIASAAGVIKDRKVTTVAKCELDCSQGGGCYQDQPIAVDGNFITCRTWHEYAEFFPIFMTMLIDSDPWGKAMLTDGENGVDQHIKQGNHLQ